MLALNRLPEKHMLIKLSVASLPSGLNVPYLALLTETLALVTVASIVQHV